MKQKYMILIGAIIALTTNLCRGVDTVPESRAWHRRVKVVYLNLGITSFAPLSAHDVLASTLPSAGDGANQVNIESGACNATITEIVKQFTFLEPATTKRSIDVRVVFIFTRVDGFSVLLSADCSGQFEWVNIKHKLPDLEQRKALWATLPHEVIVKYPGPLSEQK